jgi:glycosyltransferase involved in cell wall biosynthesis
VAQCDVLVQNSSDEPLAPVVLEAMGSGHPVVAVAGGGITDVVRDGENGLLIPADDAQALLIAMRRLATDRDERNRLGAQARTWIAARCDITLVGQAAIELYRAALTRMSGAVRAESTTVYRRITETRKAM